MAERICSIQDCVKPTYARGWCAMHYRRWRVHGDTSYSQTIRGNDEARWLSYVNRDGAVPEAAPHLGPCWLWTGNLNCHGYGVLDIEGRPLFAHRWGYEHFVGPIPDESVTDHLCRVRHCVNYERHLEIVTNRENILRGEGLAAINARKTHCKHGHELTPDNVYNTAKGNRDRRCRRCDQERRARNRDEINARRRERRQAARRA